MSTTEIPSDEQLAPEGEAAPDAGASTDERIVDITDEALEQIDGIRAGEDDPSSLRLRIEVTGVNGVDYVYDLAFETADEGKPGDTAYAIGDLTVVIPSDSVAKLRGAVLDLPSSPMQSGLVLRNPNRPDPLAGKTLELTGDLPEKVSQLLAQTINPALAAHGGYVELAGVEDTVVYLRMGGGCQGCSLSAATMVQGVITAIHESLPEVTDVVDVTDHEAGENPFY